MSVAYSLYLKLKDEEPRPRDGCFSRDILSAAELLDEMYDMTRLSVETITLIHIDKRLCGDLLDRFGVLCETVLCLGSAVVKSVYGHDD